MDNWKEIFKNPESYSILYSDRFRAFNNELLKHNNLLWFETSGSSGDPKVIGISKSGFLNAAESVNSALGIESTDKWLIAIPTYHVGGASILARSLVGGFSTYLFDKKWSPLECLEEIERNNITFVSLVPTQIFDLVKTQKKAPSSLNRVILGGGAASYEILSSAKDLGYKVIETYGLTETSALAAIKECESFSLLPHLSVKESINSELQFKGESVVQLIGRVVNNSIEMSDPRVEGWYTSDDLGNVLDKTHFNFLGRKNRVVKILGELVSLDRVEREIQYVFPENYISVVDFPNDRRGKELVLFVETENQTITIDEINQKLGSLERISKIHYVEKFPLLPSGKVDLEKIRGLALA